jgi:translation initiation factor IF-2
MSDKRISQVARELNVGRNTITEFLAKKGHSVDSSPNAKISDEQYQLLLKEFEASASIKKEASELTIGKKHENITASTAANGGRKRDDDDDDFVTGKSLSTEDIMIAAKQSVKTEEPKEAAKTVAPAPDPVKEPEPKADTTPTAAPDDDLISAGRNKIPGLKVLGKVDLSGGKKKTSPPPPPPSAPKPAPVAVTATPVAKIETKPEPPPVSVKEEAPEPVIEEKVSVETVVVEKEETKTIELEASPVPIQELVQPKLVEARADQLKGLTVLGKIELPVEKKKKPEESGQDKKKRKRLVASSSDKKLIINPPTTDYNRPGTQNRPGGGQNRGPQNRGPRPATPLAPKQELSDKEIQDHIKATLARLSGQKSSQPGANRAKYRKEKRSAIAEAHEERMQAEQKSKNILKVTEFISANDLASLMDVSVNEVIKVCLGLGMFISINQRLDAEAITIIADEFGYEVDFSSSEEETVVEELVDNPEDLKDRAPIVTIMGHVDHGKTSLLDYIRSSKVTASEAGGITQHIGAYDVLTDNGKRITFLDTPGHEAFTAMRARGAKVTDIVIIVIAADDRVMPQTKEAINHASLAGVPIVFALNKVDKPAANPEKIKEELANMNYLVESWGGKYQSENISAKSGVGVPELLEKVLLEAELLELKANPTRNANGTVIEASLDKGRGYVATLLVQTGTMKVGDIILAGAHYGRVKAMTDHKGTRLKTAGPSTPVQVLGLDGAPQAGDKFNVMESEREAREIATKREQILREQAIRTRKHITLDEIGRRLAIGSFKQLNIIVKGDVDGSIEALSDSLLRLSNEEVQVSIIHKAVGQISESDVLLASASDAVIIGFQVRPSNSARKLAEQEEIEIRLYSIIYDAINDVKDAIVGMLAPKLEEVITGNIEVREVFRISKIGTVAGCYVTDGMIKRANQIRVIRDGIVLHTGEIDALKRFKDDVNEVKSGFECGLSVKGFNNLEVGDTIEGFEQKETKRTSI